MLTMIPRFSSSQADGFNEKRAYTIDSEKKRSYTLKQYFDVVDDVSRKLKQTETPLKPLEKAFLQSADYFRRGRPADCNEIESLTALRQEYIDTEPTAPKRLQNWLTMLMTPFTKADPLTNLQQRPMMYTTLQAAIDKAKAEKQPVSVMFIDLDYFKQINDTYGHDAGDIVLKETGKRILRNLNRDTDSAYRLGGEELVVIQQGANEEVAKDYAARLLKDLSAITHPVEGDDTTSKEKRSTVNPFLAQIAENRGISASIGIVTVYPNSKTQIPLKDKEKPNKPAEMVPLTSESILSKADYHMYQSKQKRNGIVQSIVQADGTEKIVSQRGKSVLLPKHRDSDDFEYVPPKDES